MADPVITEIARRQAIDQFNVEAKRLADAAGIAPPAQPEGFAAKDPDLRSLHWVREASDFLKRLNDKYVGQAEATFDGPAKSVEQPPLNPVKAKSGKSK